MRGIMSARWFHIILCVGWTSIISAQQVQLMLNDPPSGGLVATDAWNAEVSVQGVEQRAYFEGTITNEQGRVVSEARSVALTLPAGISRFTTGNVQARRVNYRDPKTEQVVLATGNFPQGSYTLCTRLLSVDRDQELVRTCIQVNVRPQVAHADDERRARKVDLYGTASITQVMVDPDPANRELPPAYTRLQADPGIELLHVPVTGRVRYTTEGTNARSDVNMFALQFDRARFEQNLRHLVLRKIAESRLDGLRRNQQIVAQMEEADKLKAVLDDPSLLGVDEELARLQTDLQQCGPQPSSDSLAARCADLRRQHQAALARKNQVGRLRDRYEKLEGLRSSLVSSGKWDEVQRLQAGDMPDLDDQRILASELAKYGAFKGVNRMLFSVEELTIGTAFPVYTPMTLNGNQVNGAHILWNPGPLIVAVTHGRTSSPYLADSLHASRFEQSMTGVRLGFGKLHKSFLVASLVEFADRSGSLNVSSTGGFYPQSSRVGGLEFRISPDKLRTFELKGELNGLMFDHDQFQTTNTFAGELSEPLLAAGIEPTLAFSYDYAYRARSTVRLFKEATVLSAGTQMVGPGFRHPGAFGLRNDLISWDARIDQRLGSEAVRVSLLYSTEHDNISSGKAVTTSSNMIGAEFSLATTRWPVIRLRLTANDTRNTDYYVRSNTINANISKSYSLGRSKASSMVNGLYSGTGSDIAGQGVNAAMVMVQQLFSFRSGFACMVGGQYSVVQADTRDEGNNGVNLQLSKVLWKKLRVAAGAGHNTTPLGARTTYSADISGSIAKGLSLSAIYTNAHFTVYPGASGGLSQNNLQARLAYSW